MEHSTKQTAYQGKTEAQEVVDRASDAGIHVIRESGLYLLSILYCGPLSSTSTPTYTRILHRCNVKRGKKNKKNFNITHVSKLAKKWKCLLLNHLFLLPFCHTYKCKKVADMRQVCDHVIKAK